MKIFIFVNLAADGGQAAVKWADIRPRVLENFPQGTPVQIIEFSHGPSPLQLAHVERDCDEIQVLVIAGGDGTLNYFFNHFRAPSWEGKLWWGAIGLGQKNLFHGDTQKKIRGIPCLLNFQRPIVRKLGQIVYSSADWERPEIVRTFHSRVHLGLFRNLPHVVSLRSLWFAWRNWQNYLFQIQLQANGGPPYGIQLLDLCISTNGHYTPRSGLHTPWERGSEFFYLFFMRYHPNTWAMLKNLLRPYLKQLPEVTYGDQFQINPIGMQTISVDGDEVVGKRIVIERENVPRTFLL